MAHPRWWPRTSHSSVPDSERQHRLTWVYAALPAIGLLALAVRVYRLDGRSLWLDEILTSQTSHLNSAGEVIAWSQAALNQMPLFYMFTWLLGRWGDTAVILRLPSVIAGALIVPALFVLGRRLFGNSVGLVAALLAAASAYLVWYSQEARNYSLLMLLTTLQMYFAYRAVAQRRAIDWAGLIIFTILNLYSHYLALVATVAVAAYVAGFLIADEARTNRWVGMAILPAALITVSLAVLVPWRPLLKWFYAEAANAAAHRKLSLAAALFVVAALAAGALYVRRSAPRLLPPLVSAAAVAAAYAPWIPSLRTLASHPDQTFGQIHLTHAPNLGDAGVLMSSVSLSGLVFLGFLAGVITLAVGSFRGRAARCLLPLVWVGVPLLIFGYLSRKAIVAIDPRYLSFLVPGALLVAAAGVVAAAQIAQRLWNAFVARYLPRIGTPLPLAGVVVVAVVLAQAVAGLAHSYDLNKNDYRAVAQHIAAASPPDSVVLAVGNYSDWTVICLDYYFRQLRSNVVVVDGLQVDSALIDRLSRNGAVWGVVIFPSPDQLALLSGSPNVRQDFLDSTSELHVVRTTDPSLSSTDQVRQLLRWESPLEPQLGGPMKLLDLQTGQATRGPNLLPPPSSWTLGEGAAVQGDSVVLAAQSAAAEVDAGASISIQPGKDYLLSLDHRAQPPAGSLFVYAVVFDQLGHELLALPTGAGYAISASPWTTSYFAFTAPTGSWSVQILVRLRGPGQAEFRYVQLNELSST